MKKEKFIDVIVVTETDALFWALLKITRIAQEADEEAKESTVLRLAEALGIKNIQTCTTCDCQRPIFVFQGKAYCLVCGDRWQQIVHMEGTAEIDLSVIQTSKEIRSRWIERRIKTIQDELTKTEVKILSDYEIDLESIPELKAELAQLEEELRLLKENKE